MNKLKRALLAGALCLALGLTVSSCDVLEVDPYQEVGSGAALNTVNGFRALLTSAYDDLQDVEWYAQYYMLYPDALADNAESQGNIRYSGIISNSSRSYFLRWVDFYNTINKTNLLISKIGGLSIEADNAQEIKDRIKGEAYFMRALTYFDLMRTKAYEPNEIPAECNIDVCDQGVILRTEPTETVDDALQFLPRAPISDVYDQMEQDLENAISLLDNPPIFSDQQQFFANKAAAQGLLAQIQLYAEEYGAAAQSATDAMNTAEMGPLGATELDESNYVSALSGSSHPSALFAVDMNPNFDGNATNSNEAPSALTNDCTDNFNFEVVPTEDLINAHDSSDVRLGLYETLYCPAINDTTTRINKYTQSEGPQNSYTDDIVVMRLAEVRLIRAEARYENNNESGALQDVNDLRGRRGLDEVSLSGQDLIDEIFHQKRLELAFEGERWFDLKQAGRDIPKPQDTAGRDVLPYSSYLLLAPLPTTQVTQNENLLQNRNY